MAEMLPLECLLCFPAIIVVGLLWERLTASRSRKNA